MVPIWPQIHDSAIHQRCYCTRLSSSELHQNTMRGVAARARLLHLLDWKPELSNAAPTCGRIRRAAAGPGEIACSSFTFGTKTDKQKGSLYTNSDLKRQTIALISSQVCFHLQPNFLVWWCHDSSCQRNCMQLPYCWPPWFKWSTVAICKRIERGAQELTSQYTQQRRMYLVLTSLTLKY